MAPEKLKDIVHSVTMKEKTWKPYQPACKWGKFSISVIACGNPLASSYAVTWGGWLFFRDY